MSTTLKQLNVAVIDISSLSDHAFQQIEAIATLALTALENPRHHRDAEHIAQALIAIRGEAQMTRDSICCMADEVDCDYSDEAQERRRAAARLAQAAA